MIRCVKMFINYIMPIKLDVKLDLLFVYFLSVCFCAQDHDLCDNSLCDKRPVFEMCLK